MVRRLFESLSVRQRRWIAAAVVMVLLIVVVVVVLVGNGDPDQPAPTTSTTTSTTEPAADTTSTTTEPTTTTVGEVWPLTGFPRGDGTGPILAVKVDNSSPGRPQTGIEAADLVFDVPVEAGISRLLALFQSSIPEEVGPVRSVREVDMKLLAPFGPLFAHSGGNAGVLAAIPPVAIDVGDPLLGGVAYRRSPDRAAPYNLMLDPRAAIEFRPDAVPADGPRIPFDGEAPDGSSALNLEIDTSPAHRVVYGFSATDGGYLRFHGGQAHLTESGSQIVTANVVVVFVEVIDTGRFDSAGAPVPDFEVLGSGEAVVFRNGKSVEGRWERGRLEDFFRIFDESNREVALAPGVTWFHLVPTGRSVTWR